MRFAFPPYRLTSRDHAPYAFARHQGALAGPRLAFFYFASFLIVGVQATPFWPVWLAGQGASGRCAKIATVFAASLWASWSRRRRRSGRWPTGSGGARR